MSRRLVETVAITNKLGLHARAAAKLVEAAARFKATVHVEKGGESVDALSILGLMMLNARLGTEIRITAEGDDAAEAMAAVLALVRAKFGEE